MKSPTPKQLTLHACQAAKAAGKILKDYHERALKNRNAVIGTREKGAEGLVTLADLEAEACAVKILSRARPDFGFLTEEAKPVKSAGPGRWIIDPLDGTTNFVHGFPMFCVSIAAEWDGEIVAAAIYHPIFDELYYASQSSGAYLIEGAQFAKRSKTTKLKVSQTKQLPDSLLTTGFTYRKKEHLGAEMQAFERLSCIARAIRRPGSAALDLAYTARGVFDGFWERRLSPWDVAAGILLVTEAGGKVSDFGGKRFKIDSPELLASNGKLHPKLLGVIRPKTCSLDPRP